MHIYEHIWQMFCIQNIKVSIYAKNFMAIIKVCQGQRIWIALID